MKKLLILGIITFGFSMTQAQVTELKTDKEKFSYANGLQYNNSIMKGKNIIKEVDITIFMQAIKNRKKKKKTLIESDSTISVLQQYMTQKMEAEKVAQKAKGEAYLAQNKAKKGVITTASGLQYEILKASKDKSLLRPRAEDNVKVNYEGRLIDGTVFDTNAKRDNGAPTEFPLNNVIKGWIEGVQLMKKGEKFRFTIPSELAYGEQGPPSIGPNQVLIFDIELVDFKAQTNTEINQDIKIRQ